MQLAGALTAGQAAGIVQEEAGRAGAARGADAGTRHPRILSQAQLRAGAPILAALLSGAEHHVPLALGWTGRQRGSEHAQAGGKGQGTEGPRGRYKQATGEQDRGATGSPSDSPSLAGLFQCLKGCC